MTGSFLEEPPVSAQVQALYDEDLADGGYVWNVSRLWAHQPGTLEQLFGLMSEAFTPSGLTFRQRGILVTAAASALGDSYCSLAWGGKLGKASDAAVAAGVLNGFPGATVSASVFRLRRVGPGFYRPAMAARSRMASPAGSTGTCSLTTPDSALAASTHLTVRSRFISVICCTNSR